MPVGQVWLVLESSSFVGPLEVVVRRDQRSFRTLHAREVLSGRIHCRECIQNSHRAQIWQALQLLDAGEPTESPTPCGAPALPTTRAVTSKQEQLEEWLALLDSPSVDERILAVQALLEARFAVAPRLVAGLRSQDDAAIAAALRIIQLIGGDSAPIEELSRLLDERRWKIPVLRVRHHGTGCRAGVGPDRDAPYGPGSRDPTGGVVGLLANRSLELLLLRHSSTTTDLFFSPSTWNTILC